MNTNIPSHYFVSAMRTALGWTRPCRHTHPDAVETNKCAMKRSVNAIVRNPLDARATIAPAPYLHQRRLTKRVIAAAEQIVRQTR